MSARLKAKVRRLLRQRLAGEEQAALSAVGPGPPPLQRGPDLFSPLTLGPPTAPSDSAGLGGPGVSAHASFRQRWLPGLQVKRPRVELRKQEGHV